MQEIDNNQVEFDLEGKEGVFNHFVFPNCCYKAYSDDNLPVFVAPKRRVSMKPPKVSKQKDFSSSFFLIPSAQDPEPLTPEEEKQELDALNQRWKNLTDAEKQIAHRARMKWIAGRLTKRFGSGKKKELHLLFSKEFEHLLLNIFLLKHVLFLISLCNLLF